MKPSTARRFSFYFRLFPLSYYVMQMLFQARESSKITLGVGWTNFPDTLYYFSGT